MQITFVHKKCVQLANETKTVVIDAGHPITAALRFAAAARSNSICERNYCSLQIEYKQRRRLNASNCLVCFVGPTVALTATVILSRTWRHTFRHNGDGRKAWRRRGRRWWRSRRWRHAVGSAHGELQREAHQQSRQVSATTCQSSLHSRQTLLGM